MKKKIIMSVAMCLLLIGTIGFSYSFFSTSLSGTAKNVTVTSGTLQFQYIDGTGVSLSRAHPGQSVTKVVSVKNTGTLDATFDLIYKDLINQIEKDELVISYTCASYTGYVSSSNKGTISGTCAGKTATAVPYQTTKSDKPITENISIGAGKTFEYNITITFKEINAAQNYNQGKHFSTKINAIAS